MYSIGSERNHFDMLAVVGCRENDTHYYDRGYPPNEQLSMVFYEWSLGTFGLLLVVVAAVAAAADEKKKDFGKKRGLPVCREPTGLNC